ncbi:MAG: hypothetical protein CVU11_10685 [Bacteroidetes bacterium HGW-Bacteroidetes-6]|jgi:hypothetical protein|nr:MAG: hypothetical protein CVU11_10685 [Bacteroidetes bacterium HGW-Bacteroidetes-6]
MRTTIISIILTISIGLWVNPQKAVAKGNASYHEFYTELSPYGTWIAVPNHGYVWKPDVAPGFTPYATNGYWAYTEEGWTWVSNYPWGWAPFHYGRWYTDATYGPLWIPGSEWGPGWVDWRNTDGYYVWAPMGITFGNNYYVPYNRWVFVDGHDFGKRNNKKYYYVNSSYNGMVFHYSKAIKNYRKGKSYNSWYNGGPKKYEVEKYHGKKIHPYTIIESDKHGQNFTHNQMHMYKSQIEKSNNSKPDLSNGNKQHNANSSSQKQKSPAVQNSSHATKPKQSGQPNKNQQPKAGNSNSSKGGKK